MIDIYLKNADFLFVLLDTKKPPPMLPNSLNVVGSTLRR
jgi:hypothetical protein